MANPLQNATAAYGSLLGNSYGNSGLNPSTTTTTIGPTQQYFQYPIGLAGESTPDEVKIPVLKRHAEGVFLVDKNGKRVFMETERIYAAAGLEW